MMDVGDRTIKVRVEQDMSDVVHVLEIIARHAQSCADELAGRGDPPGDDNPPVSKDSEFGDVVKFWGAPA